jgi:hypothetical protein
MTLVLGWGVVFLLAAMASSLLQLICISAIAVARAAGRQPRSMLGVLHALA